MRNKVCRFEFLRGGIVSLLQILKLAFLFCLGLEPVGPYIL